jgi:hypothetical protein
MAVLAGPVTGFSHRAVAQPATQPTSEVSTAAAWAQPAPNWTDLLKRLGSPDLAVREQAQQDLHQVSPKYLPAAKHFADQATDAEVRARLQNRLAEMADELAIDPPPITLDIKNATLRVTAAALSKALGVPLEVWPPGADDSFFANRFTFKGTDQAFWDVFAALNRQHALQLQGSRLMEHGEYQRMMARSGPFAIFPTRITRSATIMFQQTPDKQAQPEQITLTCDILVDPRLKMLRDDARVEFTEVTDDAGNALLKSGAGRGGDGRPYMPDFTWQHSVSLNIPHKMGKKIAVAKGLIHCQVKLAEAAVEVSNFESKFHDPITVGDQTLTFTDFEVKHETISFTCSASEGPPLELLFTDAKNASFKESVSGSLESSFGGEYVAPVTLRIAVPTKAKAIAVPFELKNLPLP